MAGMIWGPLTADAAAMGSHWIYELEEIERRYPGGLEGFEAPVEGHYHHAQPVGGHTHYGHGALVLLDSVAEKGRFDADDFARRFVDYFTSESYTGYLDSAMKGTLANAKVSPPPDPLGADDDQLQTATRLAIAVVVHLDEDDERLLQIAESVTRVVQNNADAVAYMKANALILKALAQGKDPHTALHLAEEKMARLGGERETTVSEKIGAAFAAKLDEVTPTTERFGQSCPLKGSFPSAVHAFLRHSEDYREAIVATLRAGGDNAGRAGLLGGWLGAHLGVEAIPSEWRDRLVKRDRIAQRVESIVARVNS